MKKRLLAMIAMVCMVCNCCIFSFASGNFAPTYQEQIEMIYETYDDVFSRNTFNALETSYRELTTVANESGLDLDISLDEYLENFLFENFTVEDYASYYEHNIATFSVPKSGNDIQLYSLTGDDDEEWFYNTGTDLPRAANYSKYSLLTTLQMGDIVVEHNTVVSGITGHAAIVTGKYYSTEYSMYYIRVVEAISEGVCRSVMDDDRVDYKDSYFYRLNISDANLTTKKQYAVEFALSQLGKSWSLHTPANTSSTSTSWYCSELVWASYMCQNINTLPAQNTTLIIAPYSFKTSSVLTRLSIS